MSSLVRRAVDQLRRTDPRSVDTLEDLVGAFEATETDVSDRHDAYFAETAR